MKCPVCKQQINTVEAPSNSWFFGRVTILVVAFHRSRNGKLCEGSGQIPRK